MPSVHARRLALLALSLTIAPEAMAGKKNKGVEPAPAPLRQRPALLPDDATLVPWAVPDLQLQMWFTAYDGDEDPQADPGGYGDPEHDVGFSIPRARLGLRGGWKWVDYAVRFGTSRPYDAISPSIPVVDLVEAWARVSFKTSGGTTRVIAGQHQIPFSREMLTSSTDLPFQERAVSTNWLGPNRDLGVTLSHNWRWFTASAGVYNGGGSIWGDVDPGVMAGARLDVSLGGDTFHTNAADSAFGFGVAYLYNRTFVEQEHRANADVMGRFKGFTLQAEFGLNLLDPDDAPVILPPGVLEQTIRLGGYLQASYYAPLKIGALEPAARFSYFDDARHLSDNGDVGILHAGMTWREPVPFVSIGAGYIHRFEFQGRPTNNNTVRMWIDFRYPGRKHKPFDIASLFDKGHR